MGQSTTARMDKRWKAGELRKLPPHQRDVILETAAEQAEMDYRNDPELTAFEAFGEKDLYGDSTSAQTR